jgi:hypothetical protein
MGWRYLVIILGLMTLAIFFLRYVVFNFHESPKFLLARGREADAIEVLHKIAKFNKQPPPTLTLEMFQLIDATDSNASSHAAIVPGATGPKNTAATTKAVVKGAGKEIARLKKIFTNKLSLFTFVLLGIAYMVNISQQMIRVWRLIRRRVTTGHSTLQATTCPSFCCEITSPLAEEPCLTHTDNTSSSTRPVSWALFSPWFRYNCRYLDANGRSYSPRCARVSQWPCTHR